MEVGQGKKNRTQAIVEAEKPATAPKGFQLTLSPGDWLAKGTAIPQKAIEEMKEDEPAIAFASTPEIRAALLRPKVKVLQALLGSTNVDGSGEEISVPCKDMNGRTQTQRRYLFQLGTEFISCKKDACETTAVCDMVRVGVDAMENSADTEAWAAMRGNTKKAASSFMLHRIGVTEFRIFKVLRVGEKSKLLVGSQHAKVRRRYREVAEME